MDANFISFAYIRVLSQLVKRPTHNPVKTLHGLVAAEGCTGPSVVQESNGFVQVGNVHPGVHRILHLCDEVVSPRLVGRRASNEATAVDGADSPTTGRLDE